jgi:GNAT superfamily N-acetyltransferase
MISYRQADSSDALAMAECRLSDPGGGRPDERMAAYFEGRHHPQKALAPRIGFVAVADGAIVGYIAGHLTDRFHVEGELQYLFVLSRYRRQGVARELVRRLAAWFLQQKAARVCVNVDDDSPSARPFYLTLGATDFRSHWMVWKNIASVLSSHSMDSDPTVDTSS